MRFPSARTGAGVRTILEMVQLTRLDCAVSSAGLMRMGLAQAMLHVRHRRAFGKRLVDQTAMRAVLADMALEMEAIVALVFELAHAFDAAPRDPRLATCARLFTPVVKYAVCKNGAALPLRGDGVHGRQWLCRRTPAGAALSRGAGQRHLGGLRQYRRARRLTRLGAVPRGGDLMARGHVGARRGRLRRGSDDRRARVCAQTPAPERRARFLVESLARLAALAALCDAQSPFAEAYAATRFDGLPNATYGCCDLACCEEALLQRALLE